MATSKEVPSKQLLQGGWADPDSLYIHGLDPLPPGISVDELDKFSDDAERLQPPEPGLVDSILEHGVNDAITVVPIRSTAGDRVTVRVVVNGRQRTMAARLANAKLKASGSSDTCSVPYVVRKEADHITVAISNEWHKPLSVIAKARIAQRALKLGSTKAQVCATFRGADGKGISRATLDNWLATLKLPAAEQEALATGEMKPTEAYERAKAPSAPPSNNGERPERKPRAHNPRPTLRALSVLAEQYDLSDTGEEPDNEIDAVVGALLGWITSGDIELLDEWPDVKKRVAKVARPSTLPVGSEVM
jgi:hypothetical protein